MSNVRVVLNRAGMREIMNSPAMQAVLMQHAERVAGRAGDGFVADVQPGVNRAHARVSADTWAAVGRNLRDNTLLKALGQ